MTIQNFKIDQQQGLVYVQQHNGQWIQIHFTDRTGKFIYRYKIDTITGVKHPGMILGTTNNGVEIVLHNHYHYGQAILHSWADYAKGQQVYWHDISCTNPILKRVQIALSKVVDGESYRPLSYNCQSYANMACSNRRTSESVSNALGVGLFLGGLALVGALVANR